ncbi:hypothetical protein ACFL5O_05310, partial [Myxococcota bacterium]
MMTFRFARRLAALAWFAAVSVPTAPSGAQDKPPLPPSSEEEETAPEPRPRPVSPQTEEVLGAATKFAREVEQVLDNWVTSGSLPEDRLFSRLYYPMPNTDPTKYTTDYDVLADRDLPGIQEKYAAKSSMIGYAILVDINGYVPTHNRRFSQPLTGNRAVDLVNNRTKRIFGDLVGFRAARNREPYLIQQYQRDTGELMADLSIPVR